MRLGGKIFYAAGDLLLQNPSAVVFNKDISENYGFDNHYEAVNEGKWTFDRFYQEARGVSVDLDGDGEIGINDQCGYSGDLTRRFAISHMPAARNAPSPRGDEIKLSVLQRKDISMSLKRLTPTSPTPPSARDISVMLPTDRYFQAVAVSIRSLGGIVGLRSADVDFGILPLPKYNEAQEEYYVFPWPIYVCVHSTIQSPELVGAALERFCYESAPVLNARTKSSSAARVPATRCRRHDL